MKIASDTALQNSVPRSEIRTSGHPNLVKIPYSSLAIVVAFLSCNGISSGHLVKKSQNVNIYVTADDLFVLASAWQLV